MESIQQHIQSLYGMAILYAPKVAGALIVLIIGLFLINKLTSLVQKAIARRGLEVSLQTFLSSLVNVILKVLLLLSCASMLGIETTSFVAILGAAGLAVGLALQGSLSNFAGGVLTLVFKPYKVGDLIESQGQTGEVKEIQLFNTILLTPENKTVILPNGAVSNGTIVNYSKHGNIRCDMTVAVDPNMDLSRVKSLLMDVLNSHPKVLKDPAPFVGVLKNGDGMVVLAVRPYTTVADYWDVFFNIQEQIKLTFDKEGIQAPVPHRVVLNK